MGMSGAAEELGRKLSKIFSDGEVDHLYADNLFGAKDTLDEILDQFERCLIKCSEANVKLNIGDTIIGDTLSSVLGYDVAKGEVSPGDRLTRGITNMRKPNDRMELKSLLASCNVIRNFVPNYNAVIGSSEPSTAGSCPLGLEHTGGLSLFELEADNAEPRCVEALRPIIGHQDLL
jgi:hypothetical protein